MITTPIKTRKLTPRACTLLELLDESLPNIKEGSILAITSKVVSLCEGSVVAGDVDKDELIATYASRYLPRDLSRYHVSFTITNGMLAPGAGIDESNGDGDYILWPQDAQRTANEVRHYLCQKYSLKDCGVIITDSTTRPMVWGTSGVALAHSGFAALHNYIGTADLFGRPFAFHKNNIMNGLAAAAVLVMGEGAEQTPLALVEDVPFVTFQQRDPTPQELKDLQISPEDDLYAPFLNAVTWQKGNGAADRPLDD